MTESEKRTLIGELCDKADCDTCPFNDPNSWCMHYAESSIPKDQLDSIIDAFTNAKTDMVNHPNHYTQGGMECIDEMTLIFGKEAVMNFCLCNAWKYRYRANAKNGDEDLKKADWYINKYKQLKESA